MNVLCMGQFFSMEEYLFQKPPFISDTEDSTKNKMADDVAIPVLRGQIPVGHVTICVTV